MQLFFFSSNSYIVYGLFRNDVLYLPIAGRINELFHRSSTKRCSNSGIVDSFKRFLFKRPI